MNGKHFSGPKTWRDNISRRRLIRRGFLSYSGLTYENTWKTWLELKEMKRENRKQGNNWKEGKKKEIKERERNTEKKDTMKIVIKELFILMSLTWMRPSATRGKAGGRQVARPEELLRRKLTWKPSKGGGEEGWSYEGKRPLMIQTLSSHRVQWSS